MKAFFHFLQERPVRSIAGLLLILCGLASGFSGMGIVLAVIGAIVLTD